MIGTLNEGSLHQALKKRYRSAGAKVEESIDGFVADIVDGERIIEIQTGSFGALKRKLPELLRRHRVTLVYPIARIRHIVKLAEGGATTRRKSPKHGSLYDIFAELVAIPTLLEDPHLEIDVVMIEEEEIRVYDGKRGRRRGGWVVTGRRLVEVAETHTLRSLGDLLDRLDGDLPREFTTADLGSAMNRPRSIGQRAAYCFRAAGLTEICGKSGNALVYRRVV